MRAEITTQREHSNDIRGASQFAIFRPFRTRFVCFAGFSESQGIFQLGYPQNDLVRSPAMFTPIQNQLSSEFCSQKMKLPAM